MGKRSEIKVIAVETYFTNKAGTLILSGGLLRKQTAHRTTTKKIKIH